MFHGVILLLILRSIWPLMWAGEKTKAASMGMLAAS
jgi:hypothetical protein